MPLDILYANFKWTLIKKTEYSGRTLDLNPSAKIKTIISEKLKKQLLFSYQVQDINAILKNHLSVITLGYKTSRKIVLISILIV